MFSEYFWYVQLSSLIDFRPLFSKMLLLGKGTANIFAFVRIFATSAIYFLCSVHRFQSQWHSYYEDFDKIMNTRYARFRFLSQMYECRAKADLLIWLNIQFIITIIILITLKNFYCVWSLMLNFQVICSRG